MVVRWIHRSKFRIRPNSYTNAPIAIPDTSLAVDPGWYGNVIIEIEGTNEGLADLQQRCKSGFPPRAVGAENGTGDNRKGGPSKVFKLLRERRYVIRVLSNLQLTDLLIADLERYGFVQFATRNAFCDSLVYFYFNFFYRSLFSLILYSILPYFLIVV